MTTRIDSDTLATAYFRVGVILSYIVAPITFVALWFMLFSSWGIWGVLFGWIPAAAGAYMAFALTTFGWGVVVFVLLLLWGAGQLGSIP
jgi:hypothetical protein